LASDLTDGRISGSKNISNENKAEDDALSKEKEEYDWSLKELFKFLGL